MDFALNQGTSSPAWKEGRRVVELQELARQMRCKHCKALLDLNLTVKETRVGLASILYILCQCGMLNDVHTGRKQEADGNIRPVYYVNLKTSLTMFMYGLEAQSVVNILQAVLEVPITLADDTWLLIPNQPAADILSSAPATIPTYNPPVTAPLPPQLPVHLQQEQLPPPQQSPPQPQQQQTSQPPPPPSQQHPPPLQQRQHSSQQQQQQQQKQHQQPQQPPPPQQPQLQPPPPPPQQQQQQQQQTQQPVLNIPQHKEMCGASPPVHGTHPVPHSVYSVHGKHVTNDSDSNTRCAYCQPCPHHSKVTTTTPPLLTTTAPPLPKPALKSPEKLNLTKDERDDLKINTKCTVCKIMFRSRQHYRMHKILHPQVRRKQRVKCLDCLAEFPDRERLREHAKIHSGEVRDKPFKCELCDKSFFKKSQRSKHVKRCHMKENSHVCYICGKRTFTKSEMREHVRIHTGERPYQCEVCDRTFRRKDYLTVHMRQHTGVKPYSCQHCGEAFVQKVSLCKHLQTKHSMATAGGLDVTMTTAMANQQPALCPSVGQEPPPSSLPILHSPLFYQ